MAVRKYVVRVFYDTDSEGELWAVAPTIGGNFLESLRHAGLVQVHKNEGGLICFDILSPMHAVPEVDTREWAEQNAERMTSFGYNAVAAPAWE